MFYITLPTSLMLYIYWNLEGVGKSYFVTLSNTFSVVNTIGSE